MLIKFILRSLVLTCASGLLMACGGGGSTTSTSSAPSVSSLPSLSTTTTSVEVSVAINSTYVSPVQIYVTVANPPTDGLYVRYGHTNGAISGMSFSSGSTVGVFTVNFKDPSALGLGTYDDTIGIRICVDVDCKNEISGSPLILPAHFVVRLPTRDEAPLLSAAPDTLAKSVFVTYSATGPSNLTLSMTRIPTSPYIWVTSSHNVVASVDTPNVYGGGGGSYYASLNVNYKSPVELGGGAYSDVITITACMDLQCQIPFANSPLTVPVSFNVVNTVADPHGATVNVVPGIYANDVVSGSGQNKLYLSVPSLSPVNPNTITIVDAPTALPIAAGFVGSEPGALAISGDGSHLYVGLLGANSVGRFALPSLASELTVSLSSNSVVGNIFAGDIAVSPLDYNTFAIVGNAGNPVAVYDGSVKRTNVVSKFTNQYGEFATTVYSIIWKPDAAALYSTNAVSSFAMPVDAAGVTLAGEIRGEDSGKLWLAGSRLYNSVGQVFDSDTGNLIGTFSVGSGNWIRAVAIDAGLNRAYALVSAGFSFQLQSFNLTTFAPVAAFSLPGLSSYSYYRKPRLVRWGSDGLALTVGDSTATSGDVRRVYVLHGAFVSD